MTTTAIFPDASDTTPESGFLAVSGNHRARGRTAGAALDALAGQLTDEESASLIMVQSMQPDRFFNAAQKERLAHLMQAWKESPETPPSAELLAMLDEELKATIERSKALLNQRA